MNNNKSTEIAETIDGEAVSVDAHVIKLLLKKWELEESEMFEKMQFYRQHNFSHEESYLREIREVLQRRRFELEMKIQGL